MHPKDRQKMCLNCDGRIPFEAVECPYCAAKQGSEASSAKQSHHDSIQESLTALYAHQYMGKSDEKKQSHEPVKDPMVEKRFNPTAPHLGIPSIALETQEEQPVDEAKSSFWPLLLLSLGGNLLTVGLLQLFFSDNGFLRLEWDSSYWFLYCLAALPLFFLGFKKAK